MRTIAVVGRLPGTGVPAARNLPTEERNSTTAATTLALPSGIATACGRNPVGQASSSTDPVLPPMGMRVRLKASVDLSDFPPQARAVLTALRTYGMLLADNGSDWYISGAPDARWSDDDLRALARITGRDLEVVRMGPLTTE